MTQLTLNLQGDTEATGGTMISSSQVASRNYANHSQWQEKEKAQMMNATYGEKCLEQFKKLNLNTSLQKTSLVSRILMADWYSSRCALTWKMKGTKFNRLLFVLQPKTHRTAEIGAGLLPTVTAMDSTNATATMKSTQVKEGSMHSMTLTRYLQTSQTSQLNPRFVAEMMGFPPNWTELPFQSGEQNQLRDTVTQFYHK